MNKQEKKFKVLHTLNNNRLSGIERFSLLVSKYINKDKYDITVGIPWYGSLCEIFDSESVKYFLFNENGKKAYSILGIINLLQHFIYNKYDIVHAQAGIVPCILAKIFGIKKVIEHKHGLDYTHEKRENLGRLELFYERLKKYFVDLTLTGCESDRRFLIETFGYDGDKVLTLYNGIEEDFTDRRKEIKKSSVFIIGTIGRLDYQKGQEFLIESAKYIRVKYPEMDIRFEIWGEGPQKRFYESLIYQNGLQDTVFLMGYANKRELIYPNFDVFVLPSRYEGIPFVIPEAMSAKVPVVATEVGGVNEIIKNDFNGLLVKKENTEVLVSAILKILNDRKYAGYLVENAFNDYRRLWTYYKMIDSLEKIYSDGFIRDK
ncbi:MAG: glycosyltransferase family 4 protein [Ignavibacteria bacterium]|jgi:glycosyltransferase involved in cell wall biosynthesis|nr:glycosyltransferase family 4 protein [Ignavibacteria bacterium]